MDGATLKGFFMPAITSRTALRMERSLLVDRLPELF
jgi:hypothetical protein